MGGPAGGRQRLQGPHTVGPGGVPGASALCRPSCGGRTCEGVGVPVGGPPRAVRPAAGRERCSGAEAGAGRVGSGVHGVERPRRVRGGACGPAGGRLPHWESHTEGSTGVPRAYAACRSGSSGRTCRASACPMRTSLRTEGLAASSMRCPGGVAARSGRMSAARDVGLNTTWAGCGPGSGAGGSGTTGRRSTVRRQVAQWQGLVGGGAEQVRPVVGRRCGEVDEGGVRRGASTVGASGGG